MSSGPKGSSQAVPARKRRPQRAALLVFVLVLVLVLDSESNTASQIIFFDYEDKDDLSKIETQNATSVICCLFSVIFFLKPET
jgi:hypothetical protein